MEKLVFNFNVAEKTQYGNAGGKKVVLLSPTLAQQTDESRQVQGKIEMSFPSDHPANFEFGHYEVIFVKKQD